MYTANCATAALPGNLNIKPAFWLGYIVSLLLFLNFVFHSLIWKPFVVMRRRFGYELERFTLRIQGLASKSELAELAVAETEVKNEETVREFVLIMRRIAERHGIPQLVKTFDLWKEDSERAS